MKITVLGLGYIGLPTAIMFANHNQEVFGVDINPYVIKTLRNGQIHIEEPGLQAELNRALYNGKLEIGENPRPADAFIISVPTPNKNDALKSCNLDYVLNAVEMILPHIKNGNTIIIESTIAPRSTEDIIKPLIESTGFKVGKDIFLVHCPERVLPGQVLHELIYNNRIIGGVTPSCTEAGKNVYRIFVKGELIETTASAAEMSKLMENTYRDVNIALANELVKICDHLAIDALNVIEMANKHPRVNLHLPGPGVGEHCLAVDPYFIAANAPELSPLIQQARKINVSMPDFILQKVEEAIRSIRNPKIAVLGLTYKGDIDDIRESPAFEIYRKLTWNGNYCVTAFDPHVQAEFIETSMEMAVKDANLVLILTDHSEFKSFRIADFKAASDAIIIDTKNVAKDCQKEKNYFNLGTIFELNRRLAKI